MRPPYRLCCSVNQLCSLHTTEFRPQCLVLLPKRNCPTWLKWAMLPGPAGWLLPHPCEPGTCTGSQKGPCFCVATAFMWSPQCLPVLLALPSHLSPVLSTALQSRCQAVCPNSPSQAMGVTVPYSTCAVPPATSNPSSRPSIDSGAAFADIHDS